ncbi:MAG: succinate dehydrogenase / fumarate reductase, iron-sulfur subunit [Chthoniobacter sp.]|jgi:succinate dehydrogenase / fumarate reductase iron-sulfur subunit|nr:succinate dehydrogenase / fumarate reductase, iron-sulfur subunit [Chthoniobacter sp.]
MSTAGPAKRNFKVRVWRQKSGAAAGKFVDYDAPNIPADASFLEMLDIVNEALIARSEDPIAFDHDCREGICGMCSLVIDGVAHGPNRATTTCQLYMRHFADGETIHIEPFRAKSFPVLKDLVTDRRALDRIQQAGGFITARTGSAPDGNSVAVPKVHADAAMDAAACIGCGACAAACPNASAMLFLGAKVSHLALLPQGQPERTSRVLKMLRQHDAEGFGNCTNHYECEAVCPAEISVSFIAKLNREYAFASAKESVGVE